MRCRARDQSHTMMLAGPTVFVQVLGYSLSRNAPHRAYSEYARQVLARVQVEWAAGMGRAFQPVKRNFPNAQGIVACCCIHTTTWRETPTYPGYQLCSYRNGDSEAEPNERKEAKESQHHSAQELEAAFDAVREGLYAAASSEDLQNCAARARARGHARVLGIRVVCSSKINAAKHLGLAPIGYGVIFDFANLSKFSRTVCARNGSEIRPQTNWAVSTTINRKCC